jgi:competence protein ComEC
LLNYSKYPFLRLLLAFVMGILCYEFIAFQLNGWLYLLCFLPLVLFVLFTPVSIRLHHKRSIYVGIILQLVLFVAGYGNAQYKNSPKNIVDLENADGIVCRITQTPVAKTKSFKSEAYIETASIHGEWIPINQKMIIYAPLDSVGPWKYDDLVFIKSIVSRPRLPANPHQFNYKKYLEKKNIYYQAYVKPDDYTIIGKDEHYTIEDFEENAVQYTRNAFHDLIPDSSLGAIATALLVGFQEELDPEIKTSFSRVGAMHILAVSGLHVGIIFILLSWILYPLNRNFYTKIVKAILLFLFLWGYAVIAGFSPSIVRASLMFSLMIPMLSFRVQGNAYNNIASSAFLLLLYNPNYLFDVGFQLSYVAVFGIIYLYPFLKNWVNTKYWLLDKTWQLTAVSIAATIFTCPIVLYNFGQFPLSFLISNLIAVPVSTLIIYVGLSALVCYKFGFLNLVFGQLLYFLLLILKQSIEWIESLPFSYVDHLLINRFQAFILYALIFSLILFFQFKKTKYFRISLVMICLLLATLIQRRFEVLQHHELFIYNLNKSYYVEYIDGHEATNVLDKQLTDLDYGLFIRTNHQHVGVFRQTNIHHDVTVFGTGFQVRDQRFFMIEKLIPKSERILETDYLILSELKYLDVELIEKQFKFRKVIILNNHSPKKMKKFEELLNAAGIPFHSLSNDGYFSLKY